MPEPPGKSPWAHWGQGQGKAEVDAAAIKTASVLQQAANQKAPQQEQAKTSTNEQLAASSFSRDLPMVTPKAQAAYEAKAQQMAPEQKQGQDRGQEQQRSNERD